MMKLLGILNTLVDAAKRNADHDLYADFVIDNIGEGASLDQVKSLLTAPDALDRLALLSKDVNIYRGWFEKVRQSLITMINEAEATPDDTEQPEAENADNIATNGNTIR